MTTKREINDYKRFAKEQINLFLGINIPMSRMIVLEGGTKHFSLYGKELVMVDYSMIEDRKTGKQYQAKLNGANICL